MRECPIHLHAESFSAGHDDAVNGFRKRIKQRIAHARRCSEFITSSESLTKIELLSELLGEVEALP